MSTEPSNLGYLVIIIFPTAAVLMLIPIPMTLNTIIVIPNITMLFGNVSWGVLMTTVTGVSVVIAV